MDADRLIRQAEDTIKAVAALSRILRREKDLPSRSETRKQVVTDLLTIVDDCDVKLSAGLRSFEDAILK